MIHRLRRKFIAAAMLSVFIVLLLIMLAINAANYIDILRRTDAALTRIAQQRDMPSSFPAQRPNPNNPLHGDAGGFGSARFFTVFIADDGSISVDSDSVSDQQAAEYAQAAAAERGFIDYFRYYVSEADGGRLAVFVDCSRDIATFRSFLLSSLSVSVIGLILVFVLVLALSGAVVKPMAESYEKQKRFITDASHEIKTPLTVISANNEVLEMEYGRSRWTESTARQTERLTELTGRLVSLARMDEEGRCMNTEPFSLSGAVADTAEWFSGPAEAHGRAIVTDIADITCNGDEQAIRNLISILLDNAVKYSQGEGDITVSLIKGKKSRLTVTNPATVPAGQHPEFFDRFYRGDTSRGETAGFGIGLSMAKAIAEGHHGSISASSNGKALTVTVTL